jgi:hypothetical protein
MDEYFINYDNLKKYLVYNFEICHGGIGDMVKFFMYLLNLCIKQNIKLYYLINNISIEKLLKLKYEKMYIRHEDILNNNIYISDISDIYKLNSNIFYIVQPHILYNIFSFDWTYYLDKYPDLRAHGIHSEVQASEHWNNHGKHEGRISAPFDKIDCCLRSMFLSNYMFQDIFYFDESVVKNSNRLNINGLNINGLNINGLNINELKYISIHLRLGDKYIDTDNSSPVSSCNLNDVRHYNEENIFSFIETNDDKNILFFCDNTKYRLKIKDKYNKVIISEFIITHSGHLNTTYEHVLDTVTEYYLMTNSDHIYMASYSGFSITASKFKNIPITKIY